MRKVSLFTSVLLLPALVVLLIGCGGGSADKDKKITKTTDGSKSTPSGGKKELASTGWGTLKGKVTLEGDPPVVSDNKVQIEALSNDKDKSHCLMGDISNQTWKVGPNKELANVVVWLQAPSGTYFKIRDEDKTRADTVTVDQPFCSFIPHVAIFYPSYNDGKKEVPTGSQFKILNSAPITHNSRIAGSQLKNPAKNITLAAREEGQPPKEEVVKLQPDSQAIVINCDIHKFMTGYVWAFNHPYAAVSKGDKKEDAAQFGVYEIANVPTGAAVDIMYWHESFDKPKKLKTITLKDGENVEDIVIKP
jgi:hypothetical protein